MAALKTGARFLPTTLSGDERGVSSTCLGELPEGFCVRRDYHASSRFGVVRGMHYGKAAKLVRCLRGRVTDYVVDLRVDTFGTVDIIPMDGDHERPYLYVPPWCAHGYAACSDDVEMYYLFDKPREDEGCILWSSIDAKWSFADPILSKRDRDAKPLAEAKRYLCI